MRTESLCRFHPTRNPSQVTPPRAKQHSNGERLRSASRSRSDVSPLLAAACALHVADMEIEVAGEATGLEVF